MPDGFNVVDVFTVTLTNPSFFLKHPPRLIVH